MIKRNILCQLLLVCAFLLLPLSAFAGSVAVLSSGSGVYQIQVVGASGVHGIQLFISYDLSQVSNPSLSLSGPVASAMTATNTGTPGVVSIAALFTTGPASLNGVIGTITFANRSGDTGNAIRSVTGKAIDGNSRTIALSFPTFSSSTVAGNGTTPPETNGSNASSGGSSGNSDSSTFGSNTPATTTTTTRVAGAQPYVVGGSVALPGDDSGSKDQPRKEKETVAQAEPQATPPSAPVEPPAREPVAYNSGIPEKKDAAKQADQDLRPVPNVLERFRLFQGELTAKNLVALFDRSDATNFVQDPSILIADGVKTVKVTLSNLYGEKAPSFSFTAAKYVSLSRLDDGEWQVEVRPDKNVSQASISVLLNGTTHDFPLTVAPKVDIDLTKPGKVTEADFILFLKERGTEAAPKHDLNHDGKRDYQDDYIFTANYLARGGKVEEKAAAPAPKPQAQK